MIDGVEINRKLRKWKNGFPTKSRVKSHRSTQFRIWATQRLREYIVKGFALDDARLK